MVDFLGLTRELCAHATAIVADGNAALFRRIDRELPLTIRRYPSNATYNGWVVPESWRVETATIRKDGRLIYDGAAHYLGVASYSGGFQGTVGLEELKSHLFSNPDIPDCYMWHCAWTYRPWQRNWGFCMPHRLLETLEDGDYEIDLRTSFTPGEMLVGHHEHRGRSDRTIVFHSNTCHPHMANDGFAGTAVLIRLFQWLRTRETHYTYRLVVGPEHLGTVFYLHDHSPEELDRLECGVFAEMLGTPGPLNVAASFTGDHAIDRAFRHVVRHYARTREINTPAFRRTIGNDETVWEAPGYEVPFLQFNRAHPGKPFPEYHSNLDGPDLMREDLLEETWDLLCRLVGVLEEDCRFERAFDGLVALSNPRYDLYVNRIDPAVQSPDRNDETERWGYFQDCVIRYFDGETSLLEIADRHDLGFFEVKRYLDRFEEKGLVTRRFEPLRRPPAKRRAPWPASGRLLGSPWTP